MSTQKFSMTGTMPTGSKIDNFTIKAPEDPDDKAFRLRKEFWTFVIKELGAYLIAFGFLTAIGGYCCVVVVRHGVLSPEAKSVFPLITTLFGGVVGMIIGKSSQ